MQTKYPEFDVRIGGLWLKVVVAPDIEDFRPFASKWTNPGEPKGSVHGFEFPFARVYRGCVYADPRYFAFVGFVQNRICAPLVAHECFHAAYDYVRRQKRWVARPSGSEKENQDAELAEEEAVAESLQTLVFKVSRKLLRIGVAAREKRGRLS